MKRAAFPAAAFLIVFSATAFGQAQAAFEVASIRPSAEQTTNVRVGFQATGSQVRVTAMTLKDYLGIAYSLRPQQIEGPTGSASSAWTSGAASRSRWRTIRFRSAG
jgi:hypothetical protein